jgi:hypothetical protein
LLLIPATVLALVLYELLRVSLQSMLLFTRASLLWLTGQGAQMVLSLAFLSLFGRVWTGVLGCLVGAASAFAVFVLPFVRTTPGAGASLRMIAPTGTLARAAPLVLSYSFFILINNIDMIIGYWLLPRAELGVYAASAILPKAIITATFAVAQVVLPVVVDQNMDGISVRLSVVKAIAMGTGMSVAAAFVLWIATPFFQATPFGIVGLDFSIMMILAIGAVALSVMRILVVIETAMQRYAIGLAQSAAIVLFIVLSMGGEPRAYRIAELHTIIVWGFLIATSVIFSLASSGIRLRPFASATTAGWRKPAP